MRLVLAASLLLSVLFLSGAASCGGTPSCSPQNCRTGCCTDTGVCVAGGENAACGSAGNACVNCAALTQVCGDAVCVSLSTNGGGAGGGAGGGTGGADGGTFTCDRTPVECSDQAIQQLGLLMTVAPGLITTVPDGAGFKSTIDSRAGGSSPTQAYVYARFTQSGLEKLAIDDLTALDSMEWDIAFRRFVIRINGGDSGPSCVGAQAQPVTADYASLTSVPANFLPEGDNFLGRPPDCTYSKDMIGSPVTYLSSFYVYQSCVAMTGLTYVVRTHLGRHVKLTIDTYYSSEAAQTACNAGTPITNPTPVGGTIRARWQYLD